MTDGQTDRLTTSWNSISALCLVPVRQLTFNKRKSASRARSLGLQATTVSTSRTSKVAAQQRRSLSGFELRSYDLPIASLTPYTTKPPRYHSITQWHNDCPCRPCNAGGARVGGPCADPPKNFSRHSCRLCFVVLMDAPQFTSNCSIAGRWRGIMTMFSQPLQGGGRICSYATGIASRVKP